MLFFLAWQAIKKKEKEKNEGENGLGARKSEIEVNETRVFD